MWSGLLVGLIALAGGLAAPMSTPVVGPLAASSALAYGGPTEARLVKALAEPGADPEVAAFYAARDHRPLWIAGNRIAPEAGRLLERIRASGDDGLDPERYRPGALEALLRVAQDGRPADLVRAELALSEALAAWGADLHQPKPAAGLIYSDPGLRPPALSRRAVLDKVAQAQTLGGGLAQVERMNPIYVQLREALADEVARGGPNVELIRVNLERARALPVELGRRFLMVDVAAQRLLMYENGQPVGDMKVVVGKATAPTPAMAAVVRYAVFRPYWNVPPDLVAKSMAPKVLKRGLDYFNATRLEALSDWTDQPARLDPAKVDWRAVADGRTLLRVRQLPGPDNMMGRVKFMFPNELGVYLHDSPLRALFTGDERLGSSGCVRLEDAPRLARWLLDDQVVARGEEPGPPETRVDLPEPVPVYIAYFTAAPASGGVVVRKDIYRRDAALIAQLHEGRTLALASR